MAKRNADKGNTETETPEEDTPAVPEAEVPETDTPEPEAETEQDDDAQPKVSADEAHYTDKHTGLVEGSLVVVDRDATENNPTPVVGSKLASGHVVTEADLKTWARIVPKGSKKLMLRLCTESNQTFWLASSDMHQTYFHPDVRKEKKKEKSKARRKARNTELKSENEQLKAQIAALESSEGETETAATA